jgi:hypothetical protein
MVLDLCPSVKSLGLLKYTRRPMRHNRGCWELAAVAAGEADVSDDTLVLMVVLALPYLHQLFDGRCPKASEDLFVTPELLGTVLGSTVEEEVTVVAAVAPIVAFTGGTTGVLLLLFAHTPSPVTEIQLSDCELHNISAGSDL